MSISELDARAAEYFRLQQEIEQLQAMQESIKDAIKAQMVEQTTEEITGTGWRATWHNTCINRFDSGAFKKAHGELYQSFCKPTTGTRFTMNQITA